MFWIIANPLHVGICILILCCHFCHGQGTCNATRYQRRINGSLEISEHLANNVANVTNVATVQDCLMLCKIRGCVAIAFAKSDRLCQMVTLSKAAVSHVHRVLGSQPGAVVWAMDGFTGFAPDPNVTMVFANANTGKNGSIQSASISVTGCYRIEMAGAKGGGNTHVRKQGGRGATAVGHFNLTAGSQLSIVVGQAGGSATVRKAGGGGGGGSFVYRTADSHLLIAAGGGGGASHIANGQDGRSGKNGGDSDGGSTYPTKFGIGGINGNPGSNDPSTASSITRHGGCGAGWLGKAVNVRRSNFDGERGGSLADSWVGGRAGDGSPAFGGFGGGGGAGQKTNTYAVAGGGGGFSGGGAGTWGDHRGGGGGSYCSGQDCNTVEGENTGREHGFAVIRLVTPYVNTC